MDNQVRPIAHDMWNTNLLLAKNLIILIAMQLSKETCMCYLVMKRKLAIEFPSKNYT